MRVLARGANRAAEPRGGASGIFDKAVSSTVVNISHQSDLTIKTNNLPVWNPQSSFTFFKYFGKFAAMIDVSKKEIYEQRRKEKIEKREAQKKELKRARLFTVLAIVVPSLIVIALFGYIFVTSSALNIPDIGESFPDQGREHIKEGDAHPAYNSNPPTSGWHYGTPADWGVSKEEIPQERLVHNLEHGGVVIQYKSELDAQTIAKLEDLKNSEFECKLVVTPYKGLDNNIAVSAWQRLYKSDTYDEETVKNFIRKYRNRAPELVPCR